jgi:uncharacterized protein YbdZ (MbtH family)
MRFIQVSPPVDENIHGLWPSSLSNTGHCVHCEHTNTSLDALIKHISTDHRDLLPASYTNLSLRWCMSSDSTTYCVHRIAGVPTRNYRALITRNRTCAEHKEDIKKLVEHAL